MTCIEDVSLDTHRGLETLPSNSPWTLSDKVVTLWLLVSAHRGDT